MLHAGHDIGVVTKSPKHMNSRWRSDKFPQNPALMKPAGLRCIRRACVHEEGVWSEGQNDRKTVSHQEKSGGALRSDADYITQFSKMGLAFLRGG